MYKQLMKSLGKLTFVLPNSNKIIPQRAADAYEHYTRELNANYNYSSIYKNGMYARFNGVITLSLK